VVVTFTNSAADEIKSRVKCPKELFIGTIHSYANRVLLKNGENTSEDILNENFDNLLERAIEQGIEFDIEHLLLDEGQDSNDMQFDFILNTLQPKNWMIFADWRQSIYRFNGAEPENILNLTLESDVKCYSLNENYRNRPEILNFAKDIIVRGGTNYIDNSKPMDLEQGKVYHLEYSPEAVAKALSQLESGFKNWFILTRTNAQLNEIIKALEKKGVPCTTFKRADLDHNDFINKMEEDSVKVLTIHTAKGLEADNVIVVGANYYNIEEVCIAYVAATRARQKLFWMNAAKKKKNKFRNWEI
jgi:superfamily I DNA/RNA helicase